MNDLKLKYSWAYSVIEVAIALTITGLIFGIVVPAYMHIADATKSEQASEEIQTMEDIIMQFFIDNGSFPDSLDEIYSPIPLDPWGNPYEYTKIQGAVPTPTGALRKDKNLVPINSYFDLYSAGPDGQTVSPLTSQLSRDDIVRGRNGDFVGLASDY